MNVAYFITVFTYNKVITLLGLWLKLLQLNAIHMNIQLVHLKNQIGVYSVLYTLLIKTNGHITLIHHYL